MRDVLVTGYGMINALGETSDAWWSGLNDPKVAASHIDSETLKPFHVHRIGEYDLASQVPKRGDQRAMGPLMHYGAYACGLALDAAGVKGNEDLLAEIELVAASGGGERDPEVDKAALAMIAEHGAPDAGFNRMLSDELRPTLFLAQLPNLFAGNISIIHGVAGATRTFMGEESAGIDAFRIAFERIRAGQGDFFLVGAAFNATREDMHAMFDAAGLILNGDFKSVWDRPEAGMALGDAGAFFVLESADHAKARGATPLAKVANVVASRSDGTPGSAAPTAERLMAPLDPQLTADNLAVLSGTTGIASRRDHEKAFLDAVAAKAPGHALRGTAQALGHTVETAFLVNTILGVCCLERGETFAPLSPDHEAAAGAPDQVLVTGWGHVRGEGVALLEKV